MPIVFISEAAHRWAHELDDLRLRWLDRVQARPAQFIPPVVVRHKAIPNNCQSPVVFPTPVVLPTPPVPRKRLVTLDEFSRLMPTLTVDELAAAKVEVDVIIHDIRRQLGEARERVRADGEYSDPRWYRAAQAALKKAGQHSQIIQNEQGRRKRLQKAENRRNRSLPEHFLDLAKEFLDPVLFAQLLELAKQAHKQAQEEPVGE